MASTIFLYNYSSFVIQCNPDDKIREIINKFLSMSGLDSNKVEFVYEGKKKMNLESTFNQTANENDRKKNLMTICVFDKLNPSISKDVICSECKEKCQLKIDGNIVITECKHKHKIETSFENFNNTQIIDQTAIKCDFCNQANKVMSENFGMFFYCLNCKMNICIFCKMSHDKNHDSIDYNSIKGICLEHNDHYCSKCENCQINLCFLCEKNHDKNHKITQFRDIMPDITKLKEKNNSFESHYDTIDFIINELTLMKQKNKFYGNIIKNFDLKNKNYEDIETLNQIQKSIEKDEKKSYLTKLIQIFNNNNFDSEINRNKITEQQNSKDKRNVIYENLIIEKIDNIFIENDLICEELLKENIDEIENENKSELIIENIENTFNNRQYFERVIKKELIKENIVSLYIENKLIKKPLIQKIDNIFISSKRYEKLVIENIENISFIQNVLQKENIEQMSIEKQYIKIEEFRIVKTSTILIKQKNNKIKIYKDLIIYKNLNIEFCLKDLEYKDYNNLEREKVDEITIEKNNNIISIYNENQNDIIQTFYDNKTQSLLKKSFYPEFRKLILIISKFDKPKLLIINFNNALQNYNYSNDEFYIFININNNNIIIESNCYYFLLLNIILYFLNFISNFFIVSIFYNYINNNYLSLLQYSNLLEYNDNNVIIDNYNNNKNKIEKLIIMKRYKKNNRRCHSYIIYEKKYCLINNYTFIKRYFCKIKYFSFYFNINSKRRIINRMYIYQSNLTICSDFNYLSNVINNVNINNLFLQNNSDKIFFNNHKFLSKSCVYSQKDLDNELRDNEMNLSQNLIIINNKVEMNHNMNIKFNYENSNRNISSIEKNNDISESCSFGCGTMSFIDISMISVGEEYNMVISHQDNFCFSNSGNMEINYQVDDSSPGNIFQKEFSNYCDKKNAEDCLNKI